MRAYDDIGDFAPTGDQQTYLPLQVPGEFRQGAGQFLRDDLFRWDAPPVELLQTFRFPRAESGQIAMNSVDMSMTSIKGPGDIPKPLAYSIIFWTIKPCQANNCQHSPGKRENIS